MPSAPTRRPARLFFLTLATVVLIACWCAWTQGAGAQQQAAQTSAAQNGAAPAIKVTARVLQVSVLVHDKHGNPVTDLKQSDFTLYDDGHPEPIQFFNVATGTLPDKPAAKIPAGYFTNEASQTANAPANLIIVLLDALNTPFTEQHYTKEQLWAYVEKLKPQDHVAIYTLGERLRVLQDFTTDDALLIQAVKAYQGQRIVSQDGANPKGSALGEPGSNSMDVANRGVPVNSKTAEPLPNESGQLAVFEQMLLTLRFMDDNAAQEYAANRVDATMKAFRDIASHVAGIPGRKNLVWLSGSFPLAIGMDRIVEMAPDRHVDAPDLRFGALEQTVRALDDANVAVYPVDTRGLLASETATTEGGPVFLESGGDPSGGPNTSDSLMTLDQMAARTGGLAFYNANGIGRSVTQATKDAQFSYVLGYALTATDGKFHKLSVKVDRKGVEIRARNGYFAIPSAQYSAVELSYAVRGAEASALDSTGLPVIAQADLSSAGGDGSREVSISIFLYGKRLQFTLQGEDEVATVYYAAAQRDKDGRVLKETGTPYNVRLDAAHYRAALAGGVTYNSTVTLDPRTTALRVIACDTNGGALGSVTLPVDQIPTKQGQAPTAPK